MIAKRNLLWLSFACVALGACAKTSTSAGGSSETHFLMSCDADCGAGLECVCGVCTEPCDSDDACDALNDAASCQAAANGCGTAMICDVECNEDDDCRALGADHACDSGRCRVPEAPPSQLPDAGPMPDAGPPPPDSCLPHAVALYLADNESLPSCGMLTPADGEVGAELDCIREKTDAQEPFYIEWQQNGIDSELTTAFAGIREGDDYAIYVLGYDSFSLLDPGSPQTHWSRCSSFAVAESCEDLLDCFTCPTESELSCGCRVIDDERKAECAPVINGKACYATSCIIDGVCYPSGVQTEDGCCSCENGEYSCREEVGCRDWSSISKRCTDDDDCAWGLECRTDFLGEQGVCTRPCNYGCPTDTACTYVRDSSGDFLDEEVCLRPCELANGDCSLEVDGMPLSSECAVPDESTGTAFCL
jgi:hypothetical protein